MGSTDSTRTVRRRATAWGALGIAIAAGVGLTPSAARATVPDGAEKTLVILEQTAANPLTDVTVASAKARMFTGSDSANAYFKEVSGDRISLVGDKDPAGDVIGPVTLTPGTGACNTSQFLSQGRAAAQAQGYDPSVYMHTVVIVAQGLDCGGGTGTVGGNAGWSVLPHYAGVQMETHEIGHNFGLAHSGATTCRLPDGTYVSMIQSVDNTVGNGGPAGCTTSTYGDPYSTMGNQAAHWYTASQLASLGWITPAQVSSVKQTGTYQLDPLEDQAGATRALRITVGTLHGVSLWIEHRRSTGQYDQFGTDQVTNGISIRMSSNGSMTHLLNMHPGGSFHNSQLNVGETFTYNPELRIRLVSLDATTGAATVRVEFVPHFVTTSVPDATVGTAYNQTITAAGGTRPYTWWLASGSLPPGLHLTGATDRSINLTGTPTTAGSYTFQLRVTDAFGIKRWHTYRMTVS